MIKLNTPISPNDIARLRAGDIVSISGHMFAGRDTVLPKVIALAGDGGLTTGGLSLEGSIIFHSAVSPAGVGPTSSNKAEIEASMEPLSQHGVRIHLGKGAIGQDTVDALSRNGSIFAIVPPVTALLKTKIADQRLILFPELGMEAFYLLEVEGIEMIVAAAHGKTIF